MPQRKMKRSSPRASDSDAGEVIKPLVVLGLLGMILYGGYSVIQKGGKASAPVEKVGMPAPEADEAPPFAPEVELPEATAPPAVAMPAAVPAPATAAAPPATEAPATTYVSGREGTPPDPGSPLEDEPGASPPPVADLGPAGEIAVGQPPAVAKPAQPPADAADFASDWDDAHEKLTAGRYAEALALLSEWYGDASLGLEESHRLEELLSQLAGTVIYSQDDLLLPPHVVAPGETLQKIAEPLGVSWNLLAKINGLADPAAVVPGESLKVVQGPFNAVLSLSRQQLSLRLGGSYAGRFAVVVGPGVVERAEQSLAVVAIQRGGPDATMHAVGFRKPQPGSGERRIQLEGDLVIVGADDPLTIADAPPERQIIVANRDLDDLIDILGPASRVRIEP